MNNQYEYLDLWYFVMDEAPQEFQKIVTTYHPARWMQEAFKLKARKEEDEQ